MGEIGVIICFHLLFLCHTVFQSTVAGRPGLSGRCATTVVGVATRNALAAAQIPPRSMVVPSARVKASRSWPATHSAQVNCETNPPVNPSAHFAASKIGRECGRNIHF